MGMMTSEARQVAFVRYYSELCIDGCRDFVAEEHIEFFPSRKPLVVVPIGLRVLARVRLMSGWPWLFTLHDLFCHNVPPML